MRYKCHKTGEIVTGKKQSDIKKQFPEDVKVTFLANQMTIWETKLRSISEPKRIDERAEMRIATGKVLSNWIKEI